MNGNYATFWKCALQVNPWSYNREYQGAAHGLSEVDYNKALIERCIARNIQVVGIADHGSVEGVEKLAAALHAAEIVALPGFEIASTEKVHMVCLYPEGTPVGTLNQYLGALGMPIGGAKTSPSSLGCLQIAELVKKQGGFWFAAHVTGVSGLLRLNQDGGGLHHIWCDCDLVLAAQIAADVASVPEPEVQKILRNKNANYKRTRPIALLNSKDVRKPEDLDNDRCFSWVKMTSPTLDALRLACRDAESRVRLSHEVNPSYYSRIERIIVRRGYLDELDLSLSPNLNAIVGGRGTGKSTLIEALRYSLELLLPSKDALRTHNSIIDANFSKEKAEVELTVTSFSQNSERYTIVRYYGEPAKVMDEHGTVLKLSPSDVLPRVEVYGQNELLSIVHDHAAKAKLLARFLPDDAEIRRTISGLEAELKANRTAIDDLERKIHDIAVKSERLPALLEQQKSFEKLGLTKELEQVKARETQRAYVASIGKTIGEFSEAVNDFQSAISDIELPDAPSEASVPYPDRLKELAAAVAQAQQAVANAAQSARDGITGAQTTYTKSKSLFDTALSADEHAFNVAANKLPAMKGKSVSQLTAEYKKVAGDIAALKPLGTQKTQAETRLLTLNQERETALERLSKARSERWSALTKAVKDLNKRLEGQLRVEFEPSRIRQPLKEFLQNCGLDGIGEKRLAWIDDADSLTIPDCVAHIRKGSTALQARFKKAGIQKQAADALAGIAPTKIRELEELELPEKLELLLNVSKDGENFREVGRLSTGQQCTAVLHLLLLDNPDPLIIDQPEDNLDNAFIADHIVSELRTSKTKRQFIFATHNANIPVFGDAEWIGILHEDDGRAKLQSSGSIDAPAVKDLAANILEGGKEAFTRRREKYGL